MRIAFSDFGDPEHFQFPVYLIQGSDATIQLEILNRLLPPLIPPSEQDMNLTQLDGATARVAAITGALQTPAFLSERRVVLVRSVERMNKENQQSLANAISKNQVSAPNVLILVRLTGAASRGVGEGGVSPLVKPITKSGLVIDCEITGRPKDIDTKLARMAQDAAAGWGKRLMPTAANHLIQRIEPIWGIVRNEVYKLCLYVGDRPQITDADVRAIIPETREEVVFRLIDAVADGSTGLALAAAEQLYAQGEAIELILWNLSRHFRLLLQAKWLMERGYLTESGLSEVPESVIAELPEDQSIVESVGRQSWRARQFVRQARVFSFDQLSAALQQLLNFDLRLKGGEGAIEDRRLALELLCMSLIALRAGVRGLGSAL